MKNNLMIDIETMGLGSNSAIIQIGAVTFDKEGLGSPLFNFNEKISLESCMNMDMSVDASTIQWWTNQPEDIRKDFAENNHRETDINSAVHKFNLFIHQIINELASECMGAPVVWANGPQLDIVILENAFKKCSVPVPWGYNTIRDFRTYRYENPEIKNIPEDRTVAHDALQDAIWQALYAIEVMNGRFA